MVLERFAGPVTRTGRRVLDDILFLHGTDGDIASLLRSAALNAATALSGVLVGTPLTPEAIAANSFLLGNVTASGDILLAVNYGGNSWAGLFVDASLGCVKIFTPGLVGTTGEHDLDVIANASTTISATSFVGTDATKRASVFAVTGRGTKAAPSPTLSGDILGDFGFEGFGLSQIRGALGAYIRAIATENWSASASSNRGTKVGIYTTPTGSGSQALRWEIQAGGDLLGGDGYGLVIGSTSQVVVAGITAELQVLGTSGGDSSITAVRHSADAVGAFLFLGKSRNDTIGTYSTALSADDVLAQIYLAGSDTSVCTTGAVIEAAADLAWAASDRPTRLVFKVVADGSGSETERLRINNAGVITTLAAAPVNVTAAGAGIFGGGLAFTDAANAHIDDATHGTSTVPHYIGNNTIDVTASSIAWKKNVMPVNGAARHHLETFAGLLREYDYKAGEGHFIGMIAEDVREVLPQYVVGKDSPSLKYNYMVGPLLWGWQNHEERLRALEAKEQVHGNHQG